MADITSIYLKQLHGRLGEVVYELARVQFVQLAPFETWQPAVNAYRCEGHMAICVDLAGVGRNDLELSVERRRLSIRGHREAPEPAGAGHKTVRVLAMEIDYGPFERHIEMPADVDAERVRAEQRNGLLWIYLPLLPES